MVEVYEGVLRTNRNKQFRMYSLQINERLELSNNVSNSKSNACSPTI
jgi:hypothetical protein